MNGCNPLWTLKKLLDNEEERNDFGRWAFGDDLVDVPSTRFDPLYIWNVRHSDLLELKPDGCPEDDLPKMIEIWKKHRE